LDARHTYNAEVCLWQGAWVFGEWDPALAAALLERMTPDNARIDVQSASWEHIRADIGKVNKQVRHFIKT
jgi:hypothetical protein